VHWCIWTAYAVSVWSLCSPTTAPKQSRYGRSHAAVMAGRAGRLARWNAPLADHAAVRSRPAENASPFTGRAGRLARWNAPLADHAAVRSRPAENASPFTGRAGRLARWNAPLADHAAVGRRGSGRNDRSDRDQAVADAP